MNEEVKVLLSEGHAIGQLKKKKNPLEKDYTQSPQIKEAQSKAAEATVLGMNTPQAPTPTNMDPRDYIKTDEYQAKKEMSAQTTLDIAAVKKSHGSYYEYYKATGEHLNGDALAGNAALREERIQAEYQQVTDGTKSYDDFLMEQYGYDYLKTQGEDVLNPAYWYNKIMSNDSTNPLSNQIYINQIEYYSDLAFKAEDFYSAVSKTAIDPTTLLSVKSIAERETDVTAEEFTSLFKDQLNMASDSEADVELLMKAYTQMGQAMYQDADGEMQSFPPVLYDNDGKAIGYYHTDGQLYRVVDADSEDLPADKGMGLNDNTFYATYKDGKLQSLQDNNGVITTVRSTIAGALNVFVDLGIIVGTIGAMAYNAVADFGDGNEFLTDVGSAYGAMRAWANDRELLDNKYYDANSDDWSGQDIANTCGTVVGSLVGMIALGGVGNVASVAGGSIGGVGGKILSTTGTAVSRVSGLYSGAGAKSVTSKFTEGTIKNAAMLRTASMVQHKNLVATYFVKDFVDNLGYQNARINNDLNYSQDSDGKFVYDADKASRGQMLASSFGYAALNAGISAIFAGGRDDSPSRRLQLWGHKKGTLIEDSATYVNQYFKANGTGRVFADFSLDLVDNYATMMIDSTFKQDGKASIKFNPELAATAVLMAGQTAKGSARRHIDISGEILRRATPEVRKAYETKINDIKDPDDRAGAQAVLDTAIDNYRLSMEGKTNEIQGIDKNTFAQVESLGSEYIADQVFMQTLVENSSSDTAKTILHDTAVATKLEVYKTLSTAVKTSVDTVTGNTNKEIRKIVNDGIISRVTDYALRSSKNMKKATDAFMRSNSLYLESDPFDSKNLLDLFGTLRHIDRDVEGMKVAFEDIDKSLKEVDDETLTRVSKYFPNNAVISRLDLAMDDEAVKMLDALSEVTNDFSVVKESVVKDNSKAIYIGFNGSRPIKIAESAARWSSAAAALKSLSTGISVAKLDNLANAYNIGAKITNKDGSIDPVKQAESTLNTIIDLVDLNVVTKKQAAVMLDSYATGGERAIDTVITKRSNKYKDNTTVRYYEGYKKMNEVRNFLTPVNIAKLKKGNQTTIDQLKYVSGELLKNIDTTQEYNDLLKDFPDYRADLTQVSRLYAESQDLSPSELHQLKKGTVDKKTFDVLSRVLGTEVTAPDLKDIKYKKDNDPNRVVIRLDNDGFKTKAERELGSGDLTMPSLDKTIMERVNSLGNDISEKVKANFTRQFTAKSKYIKEAARNDGYLVFYKNTPEFTEFKAAMGYSNYSDTTFLNNSGIINYPTNVPVYTMKLQQGTAKELKSKVAVTKTIDTIDDKTLRVSNGLNNTKGLVYYDVNNEPILTVPKVIPIFTRGGLISFDREDMGVESISVKVKAAVGAGAAMDRLNSVEYNSYVKTGKVDTEMRRLATYENLLSKLEKLDKTDTPYVIVKKEDQRGYMDRMVSKDVKKYFADTIWDVQLNPADESWEFNIRPDAVAKLTGSYREGKLKETELFKIIPLIPFEHTVNNVANNRAGVEYFTVSPANNQALELVKIVTEFNTPFENDYDSRIDIIEDLSNESSTLGNTKYSFNKDLEFPSAATPSELRELINTAKAKEGKVKNLYLDYLDEMLKTFEESSSKESLETISKDPVVQALVVTTEFNAFLTRNKDLDPEELRDLFNDEKTFARTVDKGEVTKVNLEESKSPYLSNEQGIAIRTTNSAFNVKQAAPIATKEQIEQALKIITEGYETFKEDNPPFVEVDKDLSLLKEFLVDGKDEIEIPIDIMSDLSDREINFLRESVRSKEDLKSFNTNYKKFKDMFGINYNGKVMKPVALMKMLADATDTTVDLTNRGTHAGAKGSAINAAYNKQLLADLKSTMYSTGYNTRLYTNDGALSNSIIGEKLFEQTMNNLIGSEGSEYNSFYPLYTEAGRVAMINNIAETYADLKQGLMGAGKRVTTAEEKEFEDNIMQSAITMVVNGKGATTYNQNKNAYILGSDGKIKGYSRKDFKGKSFDRMINTTEDKDLLGNKLVVPKENTYEGLTNPELEYVDINEDTLPKLRNNSIMNELTRAINNGETVDIENNESIKEALIQAYATPITYEDRMINFVSLAKTMGMEEEDAIKVFKNPLSDLRQRFSTASQDNRMTENAVFGTDSHSVESKRKYNILAYGVDMSNPERIKKYNNIKKKVATDMKSSRDIDEYVHLKSKIENSGRTEANQKDLNRLATLQKIIHSSILELTERDVVHAFLANNNDGATYKYLNNKKDTFAKKQTKRGTFSIDGQKTFFDTETFNGKVFQIAVTKGHFDGNKFVVDSEANIFNRDVFDKGDLNTMRAIIDEDKFTAEDIERINISGGLKFLKDNEGYLNSIEQFLNADGTKDINNVIDKELTDDVIGFNSKASDIEWLYKAGLITKEKYELLKDSSIDAYKDIILEYGMSLDNTAKLNLEAIKAQLKNNHEFKQHLDDVGGSHNATVDNIVTAYAYKYLSSVANKDLTKNTRNKMITDYEALLKEFGLKRTSESAEAAKEFKDAYLDAADGIIPRNTYDNKDKNVRSLIGRHNAMNRDLANQKYSREFLRKFERDAYLNSATVDNLKRGGRRKATNMYEYIYNRLLAEGNTKDVDTVSRQASEIFQGAIFASDKAYSYNSAREFMFNPDNYIDQKFLERIAERLSGITDKTITANEVYESFTKPLPYANMDYMTSKSYLASNINDSVYTQPIVSMQKTLKEYAKKLSPGNEDLFTNVWMAYASKNINDPEENNIGFDYISKGTKDLVENFQRVILKMPVQGAYTMLTPDNENGYTLKTSSTINFSVAKASQDLVDKVGYELDGHYYIPIARDPAVISGGFMRAVEVEVDPKAKGMQLSMNEGLAKMVAGDLDSDKVTIYQANTKAEAEYMKALHVLNQLHTNEASRVITEALNYGKGYNYENDKTKEAYKVAEIIADKTPYEKTGKTIYETLKEDILNINNTAINNREQVYNDILKKPIYNRKGINIAKTAMKVITTEKGSASFYRVTNAFPLGDIDYNARGDMIKQALAYKNQGTYVTTVIGSVNKNQVYANMLSDTPLDSMAYNRFAFDNASIDALEISIAKAIDTNDEAFITKLGLKAMPTDPSDAVAEIENRINVDYAKQRKDPEINKMFVEATTKFLKEGQSEYTEKLKAVKEAYEDLMAKGIFDRFDYGVTSTPMLYSNKLIAHMLGNVRASINADNLTTYDDESIGHKAKILLVDGSKELFQNMDTGYISEEFTKKFRKFEQVKITKETYDNYKEELRTKRLDEDKRIEESTSKNPKRKDIYLRPASYKDSSGNDVPIKEDVRIKDKDLIDNGDGSYSLMLASSEPLNSFKTSGLKTVGSTKNPTKVTELLNLGGKKYDIVADIRRFVKDSGNLGNIGFKEIEVNGVKYYELEMNTSFIDGNNFFDAEGSRAISQNNQGTATIDSPEGVWLFGDMVFTTNADGALEMKTESVADLIDSIRNLKQTPTVKPNNMFYKFQSLQAAVIVDILRKNRPNNEVIKDNDHIYSTKNLLRRPTWGTQRGLSELNYIKDLFESEMQSDRNVEKSFYELITDRSIKSGYDSAFIERLFKPDAAHNINYRERTDANQDLTGEFAKNKTQNSLEQIPGYMYSTYQDSQLSSKGNHVSSYIPIATMSPYDFYNIFGVNFDSNKFMDYAMNNKVPVERTVNSGMPGGFNEVSSHLYKDVRHMPRLAASSDSKASYEEGEHYTIARTIDLNSKTKLDAIEGVKDFSISNGLLVRDYNKDPDINEELGKGNFVLGNIRNLNNVKGNDTIAYNKAFAPNETMDKTRASTDVDELYIGDSGEIKGKRLYTAPVGTAEDNLKYLKDNSYSAYFMEQLKNKEFEEQLTSGPMLDKFEPYKSKPDAIVNFTEDFGKGLNTNEAVNFSFGDENFYVAMDGTHVAKDFIKDTNGNILTSAYSADKFKLGEESQKTNWLNPAGFKNTEAGEILNRVYPMSQEAGAKIMYQLQADLTGLAKMISTKESMLEFDKYVKASYIITKTDVKGEKDSEVISLIKGSGFSSIEDAREFVKSYTINNKGIVNKHYGVTKGLLEHTAFINKDLNEPFDTFSLIAPYIDKSKKQKGKQITSVIKDAVMIKTSPENMMNRNTSQDYIASVTSITKQLKQAYNSRAISLSLKVNGLISNNEVLDAIDVDTEEFESLLTKIKYTKSEGLATDKLVETLIKIDPNNKLFTRFFKVDQSEYTQKDFADIYATVSNAAKENIYGDVDTETLRKLIKSSTDIKEILEVQRVLDLKEVKAEMIRDVAKMSPEVAELMYTRLQASGIEKLGEKAILVDSYGRRIAFNEKFNSLYPGSTEHIYKTLAFQGANEEAFKLNVIAEAIKGNVYYGNAEIAEKINKFVYTETTSRIKNISAWVGKKTSGLIMMNPLKLPDRVLTYSMFDLSQAMIADPTTVMKLGQSLKDIKANRQSNGHVTSRTLEGMTLQKGYKAKEAGNRDVITRAEMENKVNGAWATPYHKAEELSRKALDTQSDFVRYALYSSALAKLEAGKDPFYGPTYALKDKLNNIKDQTVEEAKAMGNFDSEGNVRPITKNEQIAYQIMSYTFGNPGTFPLLAKKLSGLLVFNTFPLSFTRAQLGFAAGGVKALDMAVREGDYRGIYKNIAPTSLGLIGITMAYNLFVDYILGEIFGMEEEDEDEWKEEQYPIAPVGTLLFGTPVNTYDSFNPYEILMNMTIEPIQKAFENGYDNPDMPDVAEAALRLVGENALSRLNPMFKIGAEVATGKDLYGDDIYDTTYEYTFIENLFRKVMGLPLGGSMGKAIVDSYALKKFTGDTALQSIVSGASLGALNELGNTRAYKRGKSNYYSSKTDIRSENYLENDMQYPDYTQADLFNGTISSSSSSSTYDEDDYNVLKKRVNKAMRLEEPVSTIYEIILSAMNEDNMSPSTANSVLNGVSIERSLEQLEDPEKYLNSLSDTKRRKLEEGLIWERNNYPTLKDIDLKNDSYESEKQPYIKKAYKSNYYSNNRLGYSKGYPIRYNAPWYQMNSSYNKPKITHASHKMGVWNNWKSKY